MPWEYASRLPLLIAELASAADARVFGGKAAGLSRLIAAGARVPPGFAVAARAAAFDTWPDADRAALKAALAPLLAEGPVAIRSSAIGEDSVERSFAGMFDTVLDVRDEEAALDAFRRCLASGGSERVLAYAKTTQPIAVGLVVQRMVEARAAGVCFTIDPSGHDHAIVIEAVAGTGDALVSGHASPDRWRVYRNGLGRLEAQRDPESAASVIDADEAAAIAREATSLAGRFGYPRDLEWASDGRDRWWLQARPITAARAPSDWVIDRYCDNVDDGPVTVWANWNVRETMPDPFTPLNASLWRDVVLPIVMDDMLGIAHDSPSYAYLTGIDYVHGRIYWNMNALLVGPLGAAFSGALRHIDARAAFVAERLRAEGILTPRRLTGARAALALALVRATLRSLLRLMSAVRPRRGLAELSECGRRIAVRPDVADFRDAELLREMRLLGEPECAGLRRANQMLATAMLVWGVGDRVFRPYPEARRLLPAGIRGNPTTEISLGVDDLVGSARAIAPVFREPMNAKERLAAIEAAPLGPEWLERLRSFLLRFGQRCPKEFDIGAARWAEDPTMILELVRAGLKAKAAESVDARLDRLAAERRRAIDAACAIAPFWKRPMLRALARLVELYMPLREAPKHNAMFVFQRMRQAAQELGARLVTRSAIDATGDVFFLEWSELLELFGGKPPREIPELRARIRERRSRLERFEREKPPDFVRSDGVPVPEPRVPETPGELHGVGASNGSAEGPVRVLRTPDPSAMADGDVIVVEFADPGWTPLFPRAAAIVMEVGGLMCHAAVVARELGIPAAFGVRDATRRLRDGERVRVDGSTGGVTRL
jgi:pyruvate,water dikinase